MIPYGRQHITPDDIAAVTRILQSDFLTQGPAVAEFEQRFAHYVGAAYAVAVANGTAALHVCTLGLGVKSGDKVITTPITFAASANCVLYAGGQVEFVDIDPQTYLMNLDALQSKLELAKPGDYQGVVVVDFAGRVQDLERVRTLADRLGMWIIEDACHAPGGFFTNASGEQVWAGSGRYADASIFSFHPVKHIATGEGGMVTTNSKEVYDRLLKFRTHGITREPALLCQAPGGWYYEMQELGYNYRLTDFQAALGTSQLNRADSGLRRRREIAKRYAGAFKDIPQLIGHSGYHEGHAYHLYVIEVPDRKGLYDYLRTQGIAAQVHYIPVHLQPYYQRLGWKPGDFPNAEKYYAHCLSLPMFPTLTPAEQELVIDHVSRFLSGKK